VTSDLMRASRHRFLFRNKSFKSTKLQERASPEHYRDGAVEWSSEPGQLYNNPAGHPRGKDENPETPSLYGQVQNLARGPG
jgi:hypothetical protein